MSIGSLYFNKRRRKKFRMPSEKEYYAMFERMDPDRAGYNNVDRRAISMLKGCPPPYELVKKALTGE